MPPKFWLPNIPLILRLKTPARVHPPPGTEGTFKTTELVFETSPQINKIQMKHYLTAVYGFDIKRINSLVTMGRRRNVRSTMPRQGKDVKKFYVKLNDEVELPNVPKPIEVVKNPPKTS